MSTPSLLTEKGNKSQPLPSSLRRGINSNPLPSFLRRGRPQGGGGHTVLLTKNYFLIYPAYAASQFFARALSRLEF